MTLRKVWVTNFGMKYKVMLLPLNNENEFNILLIYSIENTVIYISILIVAMDLPRYLNTNVYNKPLLPVFAILNKSFEL